MARKANKTGSNKMLPQLAQIAPVRICFTPEKVGDAGKRLAHGKDRKASKGSSVGTGIVGEPD
jgi:hypothetical protein